MPPPAAQLAPHPRRTWTSGKIPSEGRDGHLGRGIQTASEIMDLLHRGNGNRIQAATAANEVSSRSHAVLQVVVENRERREGTVAKIKIGKLSLVDLAGRNGQR